MLISITSPSVIGATTLALPGGTLYTWRVRDLPRGAGGVLTITGIVSPGLSVDTTITNTAAIIAFAIDEIISNNSSRVGVIMIRPEEVYLPLVLKSYLK